MKSFIELLEDKVTKNLVRTFPKAEGEQKFVDKHQVKDILASFRQQGNDVMFNGSNVKTFDREKHRMGRDEVQSITTYESENVEEAKKEVESGRKRHVFINGKYAGTTTWAKSHTDAIKNWKKEHPHSGGNVTVHSESIEIDRDIVNEVSKDIVKKFSNDKKKAMNKPEEEKKDKVKSFIEKMRSKKDNK